MPAAAASVSRSSFTWIAVLDGTLATRNTPLFSGLAKPFAVNCMPGRMLRNGVPDAAWNRARVPAPAATAWIEPMTRGSGRGSTASTAGPLSSMSSRVPPTKLVPLAMTASAPLTIRLAILGVFSKRVAFRLIAQDGAWLRPDQIRTPASTPPNRLA